MQRVSGGMFFILFQLFKSLNSKIMSENTNYNKGDNANLGSTEEDQQLTSHDKTIESEQADNPLTNADSDDETTDANEANAARNTVNSGSHDSALNYADRNRSNTTRANEATSRTDTNTGGLGAGGGNSAGEIM
jgi:hypothetical protein